ncbi:MAG TPA: hypothetical protein VGI43_09635 [Mucilaginibacter sp.]
MRKTFLSLLLLQHLTVFGQTSVHPNHGVEFLKWLIKRDHLELLNAKTNVSTFYGMNGGDVLETLGILNDSTILYLKKNV